MNIAIEMGPGSACARVNLDPNETLTAEGGSMITMSGDMEIETTTHKKGKGGLLKGLKRMLSGESLFMNHYTASANGGEVLLSSTLAGDMKALKMDGEKLILQAGSFVASSEGVDIDFGWNGFKSFLSGENAFWLSVTGQGDLIMNSFGAIYPVEVDGEYVVDTGHIVAFTEGLDFKIKKASSSLLSTIFGGEGLVCRFQGKGTIWCQSHNSGGFGQTLGPMLRPRS